MRTKFAHYFIAVSLIVTIGGHWAVLQSVTWVGMAIRFSKDASLTEALVKTFNGRNPCQLCKAVKAGKQAEQKQTVLKTETKIDFWLAQALIRLEAPTSPGVLPSPSDSAPASAEPPPTPPPRLV